MLLLADKLADVLPDWNKRPFTEIDVERICDTGNIAILEMPLETEGFYFRMMERDYIAVNSRLTGVRRLRVLLHEIGHFLLHVPGSMVAAKFHRVGEPTREEMEAEAFALCALLPQEIFRKFDIELVGQYGEIWRERFEIYKTYGL